MEAKVSEAVDALRESFQTVKGRDPGLMFTGGKDSMVLLHLCREHLDTTPDVLVIDTGNQFEEIYDFRERIADEWGVDLDVRRNESFLDDVLQNPADPRGFAGQRGESVCPECGSEMEAVTTENDFLCPDCGTSHTVPDQHRSGLSEWGEGGGVVPKYESCCGALKIDVMGDFITSGYDPLVIGRREADVNGALPQFEEKREPVPHTRVHPLNDWSDAHISAYIKKHNIPLPSLYDQGYGHTDCADCVNAGEEGDDWSGVSQEKREQLNALRDMGYM